MNFWLKAITAAAAAVCIVSLVLLGSLAWKTTRGPEAAGALVSWEALPTGPKVPQVNLEPAVQLIASLLPVVAEQGDQLLDRLVEANRAPGIAPNELLLTFKTAEGLAAFRARAAGQGLRVVSSDPRLRTARVRYENPETVSRELTANGEDYENIGLNYLVWVPGLPNAPVTDAENAGGREPYNDSGLAAIGATGDRSTWGRGVKVAVIDTGVTDHPALSQTRVEHYDLVKDGQPFNGHGTAMASLIAGGAEDVGGPAPASDVLDLRVADAAGESNTALVSQAIMEAVDRGAKVINISLGTTGDSLALRRAVEYAQENGVVVVAAGGNEQQTSLAYPAAYPGVISVAAVDAQGVQAYFSNSGQSLTISAPGVGIVSGYSGGLTVMGSGTSQSTALTSGVVAAMIGWGYPANEIASALANSAQPSSLGIDKVGAGLLQVPRR